MCMNFMQQSLFQILLWSTIVVHAMGQFGTQYDALIVQKEYRGVQVTDHEANEGLLSGTLVKVPFGYTPIEELSVGDLIISQDTNGVAGTDVIVAVSRQWVNEVVQITVNGQSVIVANGHKFFTPLLKQWLAAYQCACGDQLLSFPDVNVPIESIYIVRGNFEVITLSIERNHNFFVSEHSLLVHNFIPAALGKIIVEAVVKYLVGKAVEKLTDNQQVADVAEKAVTGDLRVEGIAYAAKNVAQQVVRYQEDHLQIAANDSKEQPAVELRIVDNNKKRSSSQNRLLRELQETRDYDQCGSNQRFIIYLKNTHPEYNDDQITIELLRRLHPDYTEQQLEAAASRAPITQGSEIQRTLDEQTRFKRDKMVTEHREFERHLRSLGCCSDREIAERARVTVHNNQEIKWWEEADNDRYRRWLRGQGHSEEKIRELDTYNQAYQRRYLVREGMRKQGYSETQINNRFPPLLLQGHENSTAIQAINPAYLTDLAQQQRQHEALYRERLSIILPRRVQLFEQGLSGEEINRLEPIPGRPASMQGSNALAGRASCLIREQEECGNRLRELGCDEDDIAFITEGTGVLYRREHKKPSQAKGKEKKHDGGSSSGGDGGNDKDKNRNSSFQNNNNKQEKKERVVPTSSDRGQNKKARRAQAKREGLKKIGPDQWEHPKFGSRYYITIDRDIHSRGVWKLKEKGTERRIATLDEFYNYVKD